MSFSKSDLRQSLTRLSKSSETFAINLFPKIVALIVKGPFEEKFKEILTSVEAQIQHDRFVVDEVFCQVIKECTNNPSPESTERGWGLLYACLICFVPSRDLGKYMYKQSRPLRQSPTALGGFAICVNKMLLQQLQNSSRLPEKIPPSTISFSSHIEPIMHYHLPEKLYGCRLECVALWEMVQFVAERMGEEIRGSTLSILGRETVSNANVEIVDQLPTLAEILAINNPPVLLVMLCEAVLRLGGSTRLGIFREAGDVIVVKKFIEKIGAGELDCLSFNNQDTNAGIEVVDDIMVACDLLKIWFRRLPEPIVPFHFYDQCIRAGSCGDESLANVRCTFLDAI